MVVFLEPRNYRKKNFTFVSRQDLSKVDDFWRIYRGKKSCMSPDMHCPTLQNVTFWRATRCGWWIFDKKFEKMQKITISWCKMYKPGKSGWNQISVLPDDSIIRHEHFLSNIGDFWDILEFSWIFLAIFVKPHLVARQNVTLWRVGKNMSDHYASVEEAGDIGPDDLNINQIGYDRILQTYKNCTYLTVNSKNASGVKIFLWLAPIVLVPNPTLIRKKIYLGNKVERIS